MDNEFDHCPREQRLRVAANLFEDGLAALTSEIDGFILSLIDPTDLPANSGFYPIEDRPARLALAKEAAKRALAHVLSDARLSLPDHFETAFSLEPPAPRSATIRELARRAADASRVIVKGGVL